jgi:hypothetical protein
VEVVVGEMRGPTGGLAVDERGIRLARQWLESYDIVGVEPTPLLVARVRTRDRSGHQAVVGVVVAGLALLLVMAALADAVPAPLSPVVVAVGFVGTGVLVLLGVWWWLHHSRAVDRRIAATLTRRVASPWATDWRAVVGTRCLASAVVAYGGALLVGAVGVLLADSPLRRAAAVTVLAFSVVVAWLVVAAVVDVLRRPVLAEDAASLVYDELLRTEDARVALDPKVNGVVILMVVVLVAGQGPLLAVALAYLGVLLVTRLATGDARRAAGSPLAGTDEVAATP